MTDHPMAPVPSAALFDVTTLAGKPPAGTLARVALDELEPAPNARREIDPDGIDRLARMLATMGQLVPASATGRRFTPPASSCTPANADCWPHRPATGSPAKA